jgi:plastocyanin/mono/diheme cytochrome c family protein
MPTLPILASFARSAVLTGALLGTITMTGAVSNAASVLVAPRGDPARGRRVYERYCAQCHGMGGDGQGEVAAWTKPKPRDFRQGVFKFRSTASGTLPTTDDLDRTIRGGLYGTLMPPFYALNGRARQDVISYLESFSPRWRQEQPGAPVHVGEAPPATTSSVMRGRDLFAANCASCHGDGSGNGPAAPGLVDAWRNPISPANLTLGRTKSATTARDVYLRAATGLDGTPMPGFAGTLSPEELWAVVHYVQALGPWEGSIPALRAFAAQLPPASPPAPVDSATGRDTSTTPSAAPAVDSVVRAPVTANTVGVGRAPESVAAVRAAPATTRARAALVVRMVGDAAGYRFEPASVTARVGDVVRFVNVSGGPHSVAFWRDSIPSGAAATLQKNMGRTMGPLSGSLVTTPGAVYAVSLAGLPAGTYRYYCLPHLAMKMTGRITVRP